MRETVCFFQLTAFYQKHQQVIDFVEAGAILGGWKSRLKS
jgi:hypothetical protein